MATLTAAQPVGAHQSETRLDGGRQLIAGFAAGASGVVVGHPMDTAKVWLQHGRAVSLRSFADVTALYGIIHARILEGNLEEAEDQFFRKLEKCGS